MDPGFFPSAPVAPQGMITDTWGPPPPGYSPPVHLSRANIPASALPPWLASSPTNPGPIPASPQTAAPVVPDHTTKPASANAPGPGQYAQTLNDVPTYQVPEQKTPEYHPPAKGLEYLALGLAALFPGAPIASLAAGFGQGLQQRAQNQYARDEKTDAAANTQADLQAKAKYDNEVNRYNAQQDLRDRGVDPATGKAFQLPPDLALKAHNMAQLSPQEQMATENALGDFFWHQGSKTMATRHWENAGRLETAIAAEDRRMQTTPHEQWEEEHHGDLSAREQWNLQHYGNPNGPGAVASTYTHELPRLNNARVQAKGAFEAYWKLNTTDATVMSGLPANHAPIPPKQQNALKQQFALIDAAPDPGKAAQAQIETMTRAQTEKVRKLMATLPPDTQKAIQGVIAHLESSATPADDAKAIVTGAKNPDQRVAAIINSYGTAFQGQVHAVRALYLYGQQAQAQKQYVDTNQKAIQAAQDAAAQGGSDAGGNPPPPPGWSPTP